MNKGHALWKRSTVLLAIVLLTVGQVAPAMAHQKGANSPPASGGSANGKFELTIDNIMRGPGLVGNEPRAVHWSPDSQRIYFQWKQASEPREKDFDTYVVNRDGSGLKKLTEEEAKNGPPISGETSKDKKLA